MDCKQDKHLQMDHVRIDDCLINFINEWYNTIPLLEYFFLEQCHSLSAQYTMKLNVSRYRM